MNTVYPCSSSGDWKGPSCRFLPCQTVCVSVFSSVIAGLRTGTCGLFLPGLVNRGGRVVKGMDE